MDATTAPATQPYALAAGEGEAIWYVNNRATILATAAQTGGAFGLVHMEVAAGHGPPLHIHHAEDEAFWVLEGQLTVRCGDAEFAAGPGSYVYTPRGVPHTFRVEGAEPARTLMINTPAGLIGFFRELGRPAPTPTLPPPSRPDLAALRRVSEAYGCAIPGLTGR
jgi:mannose-6-phosphate isomerase-like protein (cupin superfamily)